MNCGVSRAVRMEGESFQPCFTTEGSRERNRPRPQHRPAAHQGRQRRAALPHEIVSNNFSCGVVYKMVLSRICGTGSSMSFLTIALYCLNVSIGLRGRSGKPSGGFVASAGPDISPPCMHFTSNKLLSSMLNRHCPPKVNAYGWPSEFVEYGAAQYVRDKGKAYSKSSPTSCITSLCAHPKLASRFGSIHFFTSSLSFRSNAST